MGEDASLLGALGGEAGCRRLSRDFYSRVAIDPILKPLFPGKSLRCATDEFAAFLIEFLSGDEEQTQSRWWLSLRESHARFKIGPSERSAWLKQMSATLEAAPMGEATRQALHRFFLRSTAHVIGKETGPLEPGELSDCWEAQLALDKTIQALLLGDDTKAITLAPCFAARPSVFVGLLARMMKAGRESLIRFVVDAVERQPSLCERRFAGRSLLHFAAASGCLDVVELLLQLGTPADLPDRGGHTPLYAVANECGTNTGPSVVWALKRAGANVNAKGGVTQATPLHMAARRGHLEIARALLENGATVNARDRKGDTPLQRALNCRRESVAQLLRVHGAIVTPRRKTS